MSDLNDFYDIDPAAGKIIKKGQGPRCLILSADTWNEIERSLHSDFASGARVILFGMGKSAGLALARNFGPEMLSREKRSILIDLLAKNAAISGWGRVLVSGNESIDFKIRVQECVFCLARTDRDKRAPLCFFLRGVISGIAEIIFRRPAKVDETRCNDKYCEFVVSF